MEIALPGPPWEGRFLLSVDPSVTRKGLPAALAGPCRITRRWPGLRVEYAWLPPFAGHAVTTPQRLEVVFSAHSGVALELAGRVHDVAVQPGGMYVVGAEPTTLLKVGEYSDTLEMYPDLALLNAAAERENIARFALQPTLQGQPAVTFRRDPAVLGVAHLLRRACMGRLTLSDIEASSLAHLLMQRLLTMQCGVLPSAAKARASRLDARLTAGVADYVEEHLADCITLDELAAMAHLSPYHFARSFKRSTGLAPHQYVLARRIEWAKQQIMTSQSSVQEIAWSIGFENLSHFRRSFAAQLGVLPGALRQVTQR